MNPQNSVEPYNIRTLYLFCGPYYLVQCYIGMCGCHRHLDVTAWSSGTCFALLRRRRPLISQVSAKQLVGVRVVFYEVLVLQKGSQSLAIQTRHDASAHSVQRSHKGS